MAIKTKKEILTAVLLAVSLLLGAAVITLAEGVVGSRAEESGTCIRITEICSSNKSIITNSSGEFADYIELYNYGESINLEGFGLSNNSTNSIDHTFGNIEFPSDSYIIIYLDGKEIPFRLASSGGEYIALVSADGKVVDSATTVRSDKNTVMLRGENGFVLSDLASPGFPNGEEGASAFRKSIEEAEIPLVINEVFTENISVIPDFEGDFCDIIEIKNVSSEAVSAQGYFVSDSRTELNGCELPDIILEPGEIMLVFASGKDIMTENGEFHADFRLSSGETAVISKGTAYDYCELTRCSDNRALSRNGDSFEESDPTVGFENTASGRAEFESFIRPTDIEISEIVSLNTSYLPGPYKTYHDFLELHNRTDSDIDLSGWYLSDDIDELSKGDLSGITVPANGYIVVILSGDGVNLPSGYASAGFSVSSSGEAVFLSNGQRIVDACTVPALGKDVSYGRAGGENGYSVLAEPTPALPNSQSADTVLPPEASVPQGVYHENITVSLIGEGSIYYTLDCTEPTSGSMLYTAPLLLSETTVIRCVSISSDDRASGITDLTYIINEPDTLESVSIVTSPENLWDHNNGIYADGPNAASAFPHEGANYYKRLEKEATVSFFDSSGGGFSEKCGIRIFGGLSRALPKKSFAVFFRAVYGKSELSYQLFEDDELSVYEAFVLRNTGQDWRYSAMRDAMITSIASDHLDIDVQNCRPAVLYLNGEYWGLYFIREKLNENYVAGHYNVSPSESEVAYANGHTSERYKALVDFAAKNDMTLAENYSYVCSIMDVENYADYIVSEMIIANTDNGNIRFFTYNGGKWRWIMYDVDQSFRTASHNTVAAHLNPSGTGSGNNFSTRLINALLKNPDFREMFLRKAAYQLNNVWTPENVNSYIDMFSDMIKNDIERDFTRWEHDISNWVSSVESLRSFIDQRGEYMKKHIQEYFSLSDSEMRGYGF